MKSISKIHLFKTLILTSRPFGWLFGPLIYLIGTNLSGAALTVFSVIQMTVLSFPLAFIVFGVNDVYDYESDIKNPRKGSIEGIRLKKKHHLLVLKISLLFSIMLVAQSIASGNILNFLFMLLLVLLAWAYSASPVRLKELPVIDSISNGFFFLLPFFAAFSLGSELSAIPRVIYFIAICAMSVHALGTVMDYKYDRIARMSTLATTLGKRAAMGFALACILSAIIWSGLRSPYLLWFPYTVLFLYLVVLILPKEKIAKVVFKMVFLGSLLCVGLFMYFK